MVIDNKVKLSVKKINSRKYLFIRDTIYLNRGKIIQKYKSLGRLSSSLNVLREISVFEDLIKKEEVVERVKYWRGKTNEEKVYSYIPIEKIEKLRTDLYRGKEHLNFMANHLMNTAFTIDFIYNSNKIEGSRLPKEAVKRIIENDDKGNNEVANTIKALDYFDGIKLPCSLGKILKGQKILLNHEKSKQGVRKEDMVVGNSSVLGHEKIEKEFNRLMLWYKKNNYSFYPP